MGMAKLIHTVLTMEPIRVHCSCRYKTNCIEPSPAYLWSPLELEIMNIGMAKLILTVLTIGAHWSPLELQIYNELS